MEVKGKLIKKLQAEAGTSKSGKTWESQTILVDTEEKFNNIIAIKCFGDKVKQMNKLEEMAEKRAMSRAVLKLTGFYELGVFGEDESEEFKK
ncbi:unnamed protein product [marine sediment metagenome]|uniref:Uncharacterized protein n=1 Tax=marine sediment metagenome TaxID=412755 RepID=X1SIX5_9ZZZZ